MSLKFMKLVPDAYDFFKASEISIGHDISSIEDTVIPRKGFKMISTGIRIQTPSEYYLRIAPKSGLALKGITIGGGVVDPDYEGEIKVLMFNHSDTDFSVSRGQRIAQVICEQASLVDAEECVLETKSERGKNGFWSSGATQNYWYKRWKKLYKFIS